MSKYVAALWWHRVPIGVSRLSHTLALALTDGSWLQMWNWLAALAPPAALAFGAVVGWQIGLPGGMVIYSQSLTLVCAFLCLGTLSASLGLWAVLGYVVANQTFLLVATRKLDLAFELLNVRASFLIAYALLALLCVIIPIASASLGRHVVRGLGSSPFGTLAHAIVRIGGHVGLVVSWTLAFPTLVRPVWTWSGHAGPDPGAIATIQSNVGWLAGCAAVTCLLRILLDALTVAKELPSESHFVQRRLQQSNARGIAAPRWLAIPAGLGLSTYLLSGLLMSPHQALLLAGALALPIGLELLLARKGGAWVTLMGRIPLLVRIGASLLLAILASQQVLQLLWRTTQSFMPVIASLAVTLVIFRLCVPESSQWAPANTARETADRD